MGRETLPSGTARLTTILRASPLFGALFADWPRTNTTLPPVTALWIGAGAADQEDDVERRLTERLHPFSLAADAKNQALCQPAAMQPGDRDNALKVIAPFGLDDLLAGIVRPNHRKIAEAVYAAKTDHWRLLWPDLDIRP